MDDKTFAVAVNLIERLGAAWADASKQAAIRALLKEVVSQMTDEQLEAFTVPIKTRGQPKNSCLLSSILGI
jgi:hypothetical protein